MRSILFIIALVAITIGYTSCSKSNNGGNLGNNVLSSENHVTYVLGTDTVNIVDGVGGWLNKVGSGGGVVDTNGTYLQREFSEFGKANGDTLRIYFIKQFNNAPDQQQKEAMISLGNYTAGNGSSNSVNPNDLEDGVVITYRTTQNYWSTELGTQNNFMFEVDTLQQNSSNTSKYVIYGQFTGTLYNSGGTPLNISASSFRAIVINN